MNIIEYSIKHKSVVRYLTILIIILGIFSYIKIGKLEDPEFKIKEAIVVTLYPGATPHEVELEVTDKLENAVRQLPNVDKIQSISKNGYSQIKISLLESIPSKEIEQYWDNLRKKVTDAQKNLPLGTLPSIVLDDYGDVYGMFFSVTFDGYSDHEINKYIDFIKREFQSIPGVSKSILFGRKEEIIEITLNRENLNKLNINDKLILGTFLSQNIPVSISKFNYGNNTLQVNIDRNFHSIEDIENLIIFSNKNLKGEETNILLKEIATVKRTPKVPIGNLMRYNGKSAVGILLSPETGTNVVNTGKLIDKKIEELKKIIPAGIHIQKIYYQPDLVQTAINQFVLNLIESVIVVIGVLLFTMGIRSGLIIGSGLILSILGTLVILLIFKIDLQRVSLGSFIVAMGILVDNSIVVVDGILNALDTGVDRFKAMTEPPKKAALPLFAATLIAIIAFLPTYLMSTNAGEYISSLFWVIAISLSLSWIFSLTQTPAYADLYLKNNIITNKTESSKSIKFYTLFQNILKKILSYRLLTISTVLVALIISFFIFLMVPKSFFPASDKKGFVLNLWLPEGKQIEITDQTSKIIENKLLENKNVVSVTSAIGSSVPRYYIATIPELTNSSYSQIIVFTKELSDVDKIGSDIISFARATLPDIQLEIRKYPNGVPTKYPIEIKFSGPDPHILFTLAQKAMDIMKDSNHIYNLKTDWRNKILTITPKYSQIASRKSLITPLDLGSGLNRANHGISLGNFKDGDQTLSILLKENTTNHLDSNSIWQTPIWGILNLESIPLKSLIDNFNISWENPIIIRENLVRSIKVQCDVSLNAIPETVRKELKNKIENIKIPTGYTMEWEGEYAEQKKNIEAVGKFIPLQLILMFTICVLLFKNLKQPIIVFIVLPLALIGIAPGLFITNNSFGFMSIIGAVSLSGMMIKNSIVLLDQINYEIDILEKKPYDAIIDSATNRIRPVGLAAVTTIFGMFPLISDPLYGEMAITIIFGLTVSTLLTLFIVPLFYAIMYKIHN